MTGHLQAETQLLWLLRVSQLRVLLSVLLDCFLEIPTMQQGQCHQAASQAGVHCTDEMTQRLLSRHRLGCFLCPAKDTKPTAGSEALVTPGMQTSPSYSWYADKPLLME